MEDMISVPFIKKDSQVTVVLGTAIINQLQATLTYIIQGKTQQEVESIKERIATGTPLDPWMSAAGTILNLLSGILDAAKLADQVIYQPLDKVLQETIQ